MLAELASVLESKDRDIEVLILKEFPPLKDRCILGTTSRYYPNTRRRIILEPYALEYMPGKYCTPTQVARVYLSNKFPEFRQIRRNQAVACEKPQFPRYCTPCVLPNGIYIDIKSAWWYVLQKSGWNVEYHPLRFISPGISVQDFPLADHKLARSSLVSLGAQTRMIEYTPENGVRAVRTRNRLLNWRLYSLVADFLGSVAFDMIVKCEACYVNMDGYIIDADKFGLACEILTDWGFCYSVKASGYTEVWGVGGYRVGDKTSLAVCEGLRFHCKGVASRQTRDFIYQHKSMVAPLDLRPSVW